MAGVSRRFFKFKTLSPLYPTLIDELNAPNYWNKWTFKKSCEQELKEQAQMTFILNEFQHNLKFDREAILERHKREVPEGFDMDFKFLQSLIFREKNYDENLVIDGKLWIRDLFLKAQTNMTLSNIPINLLNILTAASYFIAAVVFYAKQEDWTEEERDKEKPEYFWLFNSLCFILIWILGGMNSNLLWFAFCDAKRRIWLMRQLSSCLELDFNIKDRITVRMPTLNFMDTSSMLTWLEARKLVLEIGQRF